jgi:hypothetical protein
MMKALAFFLTMTIGLAALTGCDCIAAPGFSATVANDEVTVANNTATPTVASVNESTTIIDALHNASADNGNIFAFKSLTLSASYPYLAFAAAWSDVEDANTMTPTELTEQAAMQAQDLENLLAVVLNTTPQTVATPTALATIKAKAPHKDKAIVLPTWITTQWAKLPPAMQAVLEQQAQAAWTQFSGMAEADVIAIIKGWIAGSPYNNKLAVLKDMPTRAARFADHAAGLQAARAEATTNAATIKEIQQAATNAAIAICTTLISLL